MGYVPDAKLGDILTWVSIEDTSIFFLCSEYQWSMGIAGDYIGANYDGFPTDRCWIKY